jgi:phosphate transport system substrate-binding protein
MERGKRMIVRKGPLKNWMPGTTWVGSLFIILLVAACGAPGTEKLDDITQGAIAIAVDETLAEPFMTGIYNFQQINPRASVTAYALPEQDAYSLVREDSIRLVIGSRELTEDEKAFFEKRKIIPRYTSLGYDAVVLLRKSDNAPAALDWKSLGSFLRGEKEASPLKIAATRQTFWFSWEAGAGTMSAMKEAFSLDTLACQLYAVGSPELLLEYVGSNPRAIGILGMSWVNHLSAQDLKVFQEQVQMVALNNPDAGVSGYSFRSRAISLTAPIHWCAKYGRSVRNPGWALGPALYSFMASERGQRILLKAGLLPYTMPSRELIIYDAESSGK